MKMGILKGENFAAVLCISGVSIQPDSIKGFSGPRSQIGSSDPDVMPRISLEAIYGDLDRYKGSKHDMYHQAELM